MAFFSSTAVVVLCGVLALAPRLSQACPLPLQSRCLLDSVPQRLLQLKTPEDQQTFASGFLLALAATPLAADAVKLAHDHGWRPGGGLLKDAVSALARHGVDIGPLLPALTEQLLPNGSNTHYIGVYDHAKDLAEWGALTQARALLLDLGRRPELQLGHSVIDPRRDVLMVAHQLRAMGFAQDAQDLLVSEAEHLLRAQASLSGSALALALNNAEHVVAELHLLGGVAPAQALRRQIDAASERLAGAALLHTRWREARYGAYLLSLQGPAAQRWAAEVRLSADSMEDAENRMVFRHIRSTVLHVATLKDPFLLQARRDAALLVQDAETRDHALSSILSAMDRSTPLPFVLETLRLLSDEDERWASAVSLAPRLGSASDFFAASDAVLAAAAVDDDGLDESSATIVTMADHRFDRARALLSTDNAAARVQLLASWALMERAIQADNSYVRDKQAHALRYSYWLGAVGSDEVLWQRRELHTPSLNTLRVVLGVANGAFIHEQPETLQRALGRAQSMAPAMADQAAAQPTIAAHAATRGLVTAQRHLARGEHEPALRLVNEHLAHLTPNVRSLDVLPRLARILRAESRSAEADALEGQVLAWLGSGPNTVSQAVTLAGAIHRLHLFEAGQ